MPASELLYLVGEVYEFAENSFFILLSKFRPDEEPLLQPKQEKKELLRYC